MCQFLHDKLTAGAVPATPPTDKDDCLTMLLHLFKQLLQPGGANPMMLARKLRLYKQEFARSCGEDGCMVHQDWSEGLYLIIKMLVETTNPHMEQVRMLCSGP